MGIDDKMIHITVPPEMKDMMRFQRYKYQVPIAEQIRMCILYAYFEFQVSDREFNVHALANSVDAKLEQLEGGEM